MIFSKLPIVIFCISIFAIITTFAQKPNYIFHFQQTDVIQNKLALKKAPYTGENSLLPEKETEATVTSTIFAGIFLRKGLELYINPELSGGSGISSAKGIASFTNGEAFRVGDNAPKIYLARGFVKQTFSLSSEYDSLESGVNQVATIQSKRYISLIVGKFGLADYFDNNKFSHDPRSQFLNWGLMSNGAYDYAANTRGYTVGAMIEYRSRLFAIRFATTAVPKTANGPDLNYKIAHNYSHNLEIEKGYTLFKHEGKIRLLGFYTNTYMGNYNEAIAMSKPDIAAVRHGSKTKIGFGVNIEQDLSENGGLFFRASWNDGKNETWAFTEIDKSISLGYNVAGNRWKRPLDNFGIAAVSNGLSIPHRNYLAAGGYGFIVGDGKLNYGTEDIFEIFYSIHLHDRHFWLTPNYQFVMNPGYNQDRGPAHVFSIRIHTQY